MQLQAVAAVNTHCAAATQSRNSSVATPALFVPASGQSSTYCACAEGHTFVFNASQQGVHPDGALKPLKWLAAPTNGARYGIFLQ